MNELRATTEAELDALIERIQNPEQFQVTITESDRQMIVLGLSRLAMERPGWEWCIRDIVKKFGAEKMLQEFKSHYLPGKLPVALPESDCTEEIKDGLLKRNEYERAIGGLQPDVSDQPGDNRQRV